MLTSIKLLLGKFNLNYLLIGLVILLVVITLLWQLEKTRHKLTAQEYDAFKSNSQVLAEQNRIKNENLANIHKLQIEKQAKSYQANIEHLNLDRAKLKKGLQDEINRTGSLLNDMRLWQNRANSAGLPKDESTAITSSKEWTDGYRTVIDACKLTTLDYNALYDAWMLQCDIYGCEK